MWEQQLYIYFTKGSIQKQTFLTSLTLKIFRYFLAKILLLFLLRKLSNIIKSPVLITCDLFLSSLQSIRKFLALDSKPHIAEPSMANIFRRVLKSLSNI